MHSHDAEFAAAGGYGPPGFADAEAPGRSAQVRFTVDVEGATKEFAANATTTGDPAVAARKLLYAVRSDVEDWLIDVRAARRKAGNAPVQEPPARPHRAVPAALRRALPAVLRGGPDSKPAPTGAGDAPTADRRCWLVASVVVSGTARKPFESTSNTTGDPTAAALSLLDAAVDDLSAWTQEKESAVAGW